MSTIVRLWCILSFGVELSAALPLKNRYFLIVTNLGVEEWKKEKEMELIANFFNEVLIEKKDPINVATDVTESRTEFQTIHYGFKSARQAYEYIEII